jgi:Fe-S-cluster containining protein
VIRNCISGDTAFFSRRSTVQYLHRKIPGAANLVRALPRVTGHSRVQPSTRVAGDFTETTLPPKPSFDCQTCGACCVQFGPHDGTAYVYLDRDEVHQMRSLGLPVVRQAMGGVCLGATSHDGAGGRPACVAFTGHLGGPCGCGIYEERPSICRDFEVGGELCRVARSQAGLPV